MSANMPPSFNGKSHRKTWAAPTRNARTTATPTTTVRRCSARSCGSDAGRAGAVTGSAGLIGTARSAIGIDDLFGASGRDGDRMAAQAMTGEDRGMVVSKCRVIAPDPTVALQPDRIMVGHDQRIDQMPLTPLHDRADRSTEDAVDRIRDGMVHRQRNSEEWPILAVGDQHLPVAVQARKDID